MATNLVFLVPGFLGFENFEDYAYFAERVSTALRAILNERSPQGGIVVPVPIPPSGSLADRQFALGRTLTARAKAISQATGQEVAVHLLGHSTGGVDAQLLTVGKALKGRSWSDFGGEDVGWLRSRVRSVISLASPHQGTCFANDPVARWFASDSLGSFLSRAPSAGRRALPAIGRILRELPDIVTDPVLRSLITNVLASEETWPFLHSILGSRELVDDLTPERATGRYVALDPGLQVLRRSFVTIAGTTPTQQRTVLEAAKQSIKAVQAAIAAPGERPSGPDALFALLLDQTSGRSTGCAQHAPLLPNSVKCVEDALANPALLIKAPSTPLPTQVDTAVSDGVVNTVRQMIDPSDPSEIAGVLVADHFDVLGHYDRKVFEVDPKTGEEKLLDERAGLLHSGSQFRDEQFFALMARIVDAMMPALAR